MMKKLSFLVFVVFLTACNAVARYNKQRLQPILPEKLHEDIDFTYRKLQQLHPQLYRYISKEKLEYKMDSLKNTITTPLTPAEFFYRLQPVLTEIRQGHLMLQTPAQRYTKTESKRFKKNSSLYSRMKYKIENDKIFVVANQDSVKNIVPGTEIIGINGTTAQSYLQKYSTLITGDGKSRTLNNHFLSDEFFSMLHFDEGYQDSAKIETKWKEELRTVMLTRKLKKDTATNAKNTDHWKVKKVQDYDEHTEQYNWNLSFLDADSITAVMKIKKFSHFSSKKFYQQAFQTLKNADTQNLILDVRHNYGGSLNEINTLYSYLNSEPKNLVKPFQLASRSSAYRTNYFGNSGIILTFFKAVFYPVFLIGQLTSVRKDSDGTTIYKTRQSKPAKLKKEAFSGKEYMLIDGASFSASAILASKLQYDQSAIIVGEESGGAYDGTVAGFNSRQKLPHSKLILPIGLLYLQADVISKNDGRGVIPDIEIVPTIEDALQNTDPVLDFIKNDIEKRNVKNID